MINIAAAAAANTLYYFDRNENEAMRGWIDPRLSSWNRQLYCVIWFETRKKYVERITVFPFHCDFTFITLRFLSSCKTHTDKIMAIQNGRQLIHNTKMQLHNEYYVIAINIYLCIYTTIEGGKEKDDDAATSRPDRAHRVCEWKFCLTRRRASFLRFEPAENLFITFMYKGAVPCLRLNTYVCTKT